jgi:hypothetical protein
VLGGGMVNSKNSTVKLDKYLYKLSRCKFGTRDWKKNEDGIVELLVNGSKDSLLDDERKYYNMRYDSIRGI